ncbi:MAG: class I adenylate-forming enzyme family protein [Candidatus Omnitrophica bacterium]|nr:class I adenylate-forming enzyme family protein [Candidatus Omnitrophota bacterium]MDD5691221.1 class I adenylate-forming enzyme family protein [Candidatus Omnitrophota bacterium]
MDIVNILKQCSEEYAQRPAVIFGQEQISFVQLKDKVFSLAQGLLKLGVKRGDKVAIYLPNWPEYIYSYLAIWSIGACSVPLDFMLTEEEMLSCLSHSEAKIIITKHKANISFANLRSGLPSLKHIISCRLKEEGVLSFEDLLAGDANIFSGSEAKENDYAIIFYTSGTTGKPKGVLISYLQLGAPPKSMAFFVNADLSSRDVTLCALPFSHLGGLIYIQNTITFGLTMVLMERFMPLDFLRNVQNYKINFFWIVPSMYYALLQLKEFETFDLSSLRWIVTFGASNSPDALRRFHQFCPKAHLLNGWGLTETNAPTVVLPMGSKNIESVGRPAPWIKVSIFDDNAQELKVNEVGEVAVKSWVVTDGYLKDEKLTRQTIRNGWFYTGDLGRFDAEGFLYIVGRKKEMIKVGGEIVFEPEVESVLLKHPDIAEAAVVGVSDKLRGELPKAFLVAKEGKNIADEDLRFFLRQHLAHFKIPHYFEFCVELPKNRTGKVDKEKLRIRS